MLPVLIYSIEFVKMLLGKLGTCVEYEAFQLKNLLIQRSYLMINFEGYFLSLVGYLSLSSSLYYLLFSLALSWKSWVFKLWDCIFIIICGTGTKVFFLMNECAKYHINDTGVLMRSWLLSQWRSKAWKKKDF